MKYVVRSGKKRGRGQYLTYVSGVWVLEGMWYYAPQTAKGAQVQVRRKPDYVTRVL